MWNLKLVKSDYKLMNLPGVISETPLIVDQISWSCDVFTKDPQVPNVRHVAMAHWSVYREVDHPRGIFCFSRMSTQDLIGFVIQILPIIAW